MVHKPRLNKLIQLLEEGKPAFGTFVANGNLDGLDTVTDAGYDFVIIENEHKGMHFTDLRISLQFFLNRKKVSSQGNLQADPTPLVRISPNAEEIANNQWVLKQTLDHGPYGIVLPRLETVEAAKAAVIASRYSQIHDARDKDPVGERGWSPGMAARYWGLSVPEYYKTADLWPLDPEGELLLMAICESVKGIQNLPDILNEVKGIGMVLAGPGDMSVSMGVGTDTQSSQVQEGLLRTLEICKQYGVPCATNAVTPEAIDMRISQGFSAFITYADIVNPALTHGISKRRVELS